MISEVNRCAWCDEESQLYVEYHDNEWGVPLADDRKLFEMLILEGMQAGLSWLTILKKRSAFRQAFDGFNPAKVAKYSEDDIISLLGNADIIRNKLKIRAAVQNAAVYIGLQNEYGSFARYLWAFVDYTPVQNSFVSMAELPASTPVSIAMSKDLKKRGMNFVGPTILYAFMQAVGLVNDHQTDCFRYQQCKALGKEFRLL